jgi:hypothetical protein
MMMVPESAVDGFEPTKTVDVPLKAVKVVLSSDPSSWIESAVTPLAGLPMFQVSAKALQFGFAVLFGFEVPAATAVKVPFQEVPEGEQAGA